VAGSAQRHRPEPGTSVRPGTLTPGRSARGRRAPARLGQATPGPG